MGEHIIEGEFQSDKYPTCPRGKVPLSTKDPMAMDLLWEYAQRRLQVDEEFSNDLCVCLVNAGYVWPKITDKPTDQELLIDLKNLNHCFRDDFEEEDHEGGELITNTINRLVAKIKELERLKIGFGKMAIEKLSTECKLSDAEWILKRSKPTSRIAIIKQINEYFSGRKWASAKSSEDRINDLKQELEDRKSYIKDLNFENERLNNKLNKMCEKLNQQNGEKNDR